MPDWLEEVLIVVAVFTLALGTATLLIWWERRLLGFFQDRMGPNRVGPGGLAQVVADMVKIFTKEDWVPPFADRAVFVIAPAIVVLTALLSFLVIPITADVVIADLNVALLLVLGLSSLAVYSIILAGWSSRSKYSVLGSLRGAAQLVSYEVFMGLALMGVVLQAGTFSLVGIVEAQRTVWYAGPQLVGLIVFVIAALAELRRIPFDLVEAESEIIAGFHTEYSGMKFGMFYVGEYIAVTFMSAFIVTLFFGGWLGPWLPDAVWFILKTVLVISFFILVRATFPRVRYDQLMSFGWKVLLPLSLLNLLITGALVVAWS
jgi:NADH-quinone oxidoreductase subunit H